jgi:hypothetical protein
MKTAEAISCYRNEKARRAERHAQRPEIVAAKAEYLRSLEAQRAAGRGGRPKGSKNGGNSLAGKVTASRPHIFAQKCEPGDELIVALAHYSGGA